MLAKASREYARLSIRFDIDNVFNFFVTANHIRDYVEKTDSVSNAAIKCFFQDQDMADCRDLCDKAKHLRLTKRPDPTTHRWSGAVGDAPVGAVPVGGGGRWELWSDGRVVDIERLASRVVEKWEAFFEEHGL